MNYSGIINCSIVDGNGFRVSLFVSGCKHHCKGCQNCETWNHAYGKPYTDNVEEILFDRIDKPYIKGLTLTGGDPLWNCEDVLGIIKRFRDRFGNTKDIWLYTGFTMDEIEAEGGLRKEIVGMCDYVVDGRFEIVQRDIKLPFRGSRNQVIWERKDDGTFVRSGLN